MTQTVPWIALPLSAASPDRESGFELLPDAVRRLVEVVGLQGTLDLVKRFGGQDLTIPEVSNGSAKGWHALALAVGDSAAAKLVQRYATTVMYVPAARAALLRHRDQEILRRADAGEPLAVLRRQFKLADRSLNAVLAQQRKKTSATSARKAPVPVVQAAPKIAPVKPQPFASSAEERASAQPSDPTAQLRNESRVDGWRQLPWRVDDNYLGGFDASTGQGLGGGLW